MSKRSKGTMKPSDKKARLATKKSAAKDSSRMRTSSSQASVKRSASKLKPAQTSKRDLAAKQKSKTQSKAQKKGNVRKVVTIIAISFFALLMVMSMLLPSFGSMFSSSSSSDDTEETGSSVSVGSGSSATVADADSVDGVFASYSKEISTLETTLSDDPDNLASLNNLGLLYMECATDASSYESTDEDTQKVQQFYETAIGYFDRYLELQDSAAARVSRALCQLYEEDISSALTSLQETTEVFPDYGPGWVYLGVAYYENEQTDSARRAFLKAQEVEPDDKLGSYSYASQYLSEIESEAEEANPTGSDTDESSGYDEINDLLGGNYSY